MPDYDLLMVREIFHPWRRSKIEPWRTFRAQGTLNFLRDSSSRRRRR